MSEEAQAKPQMEAPQPPTTMRAVIVPIELFNQIVDCINKAPHDLAGPCLNQMKTLQVNDIAIGPKPT